MRVSDLARKIGIKTEELRAKLPEFGVDANLIELANDRANEIVKKWEQKKDEEEKGAELMGMVFDEEDGEHIEVFLE